MSHRIRHPGFAAKRQSAEQAAQFIRHGMTVGMSGFTGAGYPKAVPAPWPSASPPVTAPASPFASRC